MVSDRGLNYALGNLLAGPSQWRNMYSTGASVAFIVNVSLAYLNILPPLYSGSSSEIADTLGVFILELVNAMLPIVAWAMDRPIKAVLTVIVYIFVGLSVWTVKYEAATGGF
ncbi:hypothetical protein [Haloarcula onubensis]|uniref:Uncharacterized protein n=1 Tax=Haloarcula onubensis TaxID=2950539 RepID=A0ABU2FIG5_9EURY|nr:hypothetical protein [Halomicroarcula sp. S3CR25-11]MDS0280554.1 hypothetical protein [Halomicroarcula sp. S3CR25-11]